MQFTKFSALALLVLSAGCDTIQTGNSTKQEMEQTEVNHQRLVQATPAPTFDRSLERENLVERLKRFNVANKIGYVYILGNQGQVVAFYTIKGKVSSMNSLLTTPQQVIRVPNYEKNTYATVPSPDLDGSYGNNPDGVFFFTTTGAMIETTMNFIYTDQPLKVTTPVTLIEK